MDGLLTAVFDAFALKEQPEQLLAEGDALPLFCDHTYHVTTDEEKARRVWAGLEKKLVTNIARRVLHEQLRMKQFIRFQKAKDGTYLGVVSPDHNVLPIIIDHFQDRFNDQPWLIYDAKRHYGYYYSLTPGPSPKGEGSNMPIRVSFEDEATVPFDLSNGKLDAEVLSDNDQLFQDLWRTYFKAICIKERMNPRKQLKDMPRRYWKYMTEKN